MNEQQTFVGNHKNYYIYALVHRVTNRLHSFTTAGTNEVFANYLLVEKYIDSKKRN